MTTTPAITTAGTAPIAGADQSHDVVTLGPVAPSPGEVVAVARRGASVQLGQDALAAIAHGRAAVDRLARGSAPAYGISTGFGALATRSIAPARRRDLQRSLVRSHAAGSGPLVEAEVVRAMMMLRLRTLASGRTGVRPVVAEALAALLDSGLVPVVHEHGSLGCSGDLAPLAHVALVLIGEGEVLDDGVRRTTAEAFADHGLHGVTLEEKEGLALINGTDGMLGMLLLALEDLGRLHAVADVTAACSVEALLGTPAPFAAALQALRPHPGQRDSAANLVRLLEGSAVVASHATPQDTRVQDAYSLRCSPQVAGAARDGLRHAAAVAAIELGSSIDNPVVLDDGTVVSNGNFHGAPLGHVLDLLAIGCADLAAIAERRTDRLLDVARNQGLPPFLADDPGVDSGLMIAQYTAAGIVAELQRLAVPASVQTIPSSAMQEDHVSMGWHAARSLRRAVDGLARVLAIELLTATRALEMRSPLRPAPGTGAALAAVREIVDGPGPDRWLAPEIDAVHLLVVSGELLVRVERAIGRLARPPDADHRTDPHESDPPTAPPTAAGGDDR